MDAMHPARVRFLPPTTMRSYVAPAATTELLSRLQTSTGSTSGPLLRDLSQVALINPVGLRTMAARDQGALTARGIAPAHLAGTAAHLAPGHTEDGETGPACNIHSAGLMPPGAPTGSPASPVAPAEQAPGRLQSASEVPPSPEPQQAGPPDATAADGPARRLDPAQVTTRLHHVPDGGPRENMILLGPLAPQPTAVAPSARPSSRRPLSKSAAAALYTYVIAGVLQSASVAFDAARQIHALAAR